ncbi:MAG: 30S ribosomal protein S27e, partial [Candidatus Aenigmatarchaeota archaeon]
MESPKSKFLKVKCKKCRNEQIIFNKTATVV